MFDDFFLCSQESGGLRRYGSIPRDELLVAARCSQGYSVISIKGAGACRRVLALTSQSDMSGLLRTTLKNRDPALPSAPLHIGMVHVASCIGKV